MLAFSDLTLNLATREVRRGGRQIELTRTEFTLLEMFLHRPRRVLDRSFILEEVWGYDFPTTANSLEVYVGYLRRKTEAEGEPRLIHTVRGVGYVLRGVMNGPLGRFRYRRSLASRVILLTTFAVGLSVAIVALAAYLTVRHQLQSTMDESLHRRAVLRRPATTGEQLHRAARSRPGCRARRTRWWATSPPTASPGRPPRRNEQPIPLSGPELAVAQRHQHLVLPDRSRPRRRGLPGRDGAHVQRRHRARGGPVAGAQRAHARQARPGDVLLRRSSG